MDRAVAVGADEQVLAARDDLADDLPGQVRGREARHAEVRPREHPAGKRAVHARRRREHRVAFCHLATSSGTVARCVKPDV